MKDKWSGFEKKWHIVNDLLVVVPCGQSKVWDQSPDHGPAPARDAYNGSPFKVNREYAERFGADWLILSAKYGFIGPDSILPGPYNVTFKRKSTGPVSMDALREQVKQLRLDRFATVIGLGGKEYRQAIEAAFAGTSATLRFPFAGLPIGKAMRATKLAIKSGDPSGKQEKSDDGETPQRPPTSKPSSNTLPTEQCSNDACGTLHEWFGQLPVFRFPFDSKAIPQNGIYILFQQGETAHDANRIVRVGTHTGDRQLRSRLKQHFLNENKDRSIFRKNIGRCLLNAANDPLLEVWELDLTSRAAREAHADRVDFDRQKELEREVSKYIQDQFWFVTLEVPEKGDRLALELKIVSTVSRCRNCRPSPGWLGMSSPKQRIRESGLWQVNELYKTPLSEDDLARLQLMTK